MAARLAPFVLRGAARCEGVEMPPVSFGCAYGDWTGQRPFTGFLPENANRALRLAYDAGHRAFDGAHYYQTDVALGRTLAPSFADGSLSRQDLWLQTKVGHALPDPTSKFNPLRATDYRKQWGEAELREHTLRQLWTSVDELGVGYVDIVLLHWPGAFPQEGLPVPEEAHARWVRRVMYTTMLSALDAHVTRAVGVSNWSKRHLEQLQEDVPGVRMPAVNQIEVSPYCYDAELLDYCNAVHILPQAYAPLGSGQFGLLQDPVLTALAEAKGVSVGQVVCRYLYEMGISSVPKASSAARMKQNLDLASFSFTPEDVAAVRALSEGKEPRRTCPAPSAIV
eukprot:TRINITY_DN2078_c3_g1_i1.p2 TRINITY_DN2078_c3_g1~~TRINITY_DN2078_c3_g1_i1.p2  ORF type:complete len:338 (+),score=105.81 TRINITY_DN2078_c3_g1_i1:54-1067(+)